MIDWIKEFCAKIGAKIGLSANTVFWIGVGAVALLLVVIVVIIVAIVKKKKKKKRKLMQKKAKADTLDSAEEEKQQESVAPVVEEKVEPVVEANEPTETAETTETLEKVEEQPIIEQAQPVEEKVEQAPIEKEQKKPAKKAPAKKPAEKPVKKLNGKWAVEIKRAGEYVAKLTASNGEVMLYSETYTTEEGARNGIATIIKGLESGKVVLYQDKGGNYYSKIKTANNRLLCVGEIYKSKEQCLKAIETVKRIAPLSSISPELVEGARYIEYTPAIIDETKKVMRGKWKIEENDGKFTARLYASNGQLMLATEEVANKATATKAIESVKKNAKEGNFIIDKDKFGRFYYKLRNVQRAIICIGEAYESLDSCVSAIESVRRFALSSSIVTQ